MIRRRVLWVGKMTETSRELVAALRELEDYVEVDVVPDGEKALHVLSLNKAAHLIVVVDLQFAGMTAGNLISGIKHTNPAIEIIVLTGQEISWSTLTAPRNYRPILLAPTSDKDTLVSCVAKLLEIVEAKEDYALLSARISKNVTTARKGTDALLGMLQRQNSIGMITIRRDGFFSSSNFEAERLTGYSAEEVAHIQVWAQTLLTDYDRVRSLLLLIEETWSRHSGKETLILPIQRKDGRNATVAVTLMALPDETGQPRQILLLFYDPAQFDAAIQYDHLVESGSHAFYAYHPAKGFLRMSASALDLINRGFSTNLTANDVLGSKPTNLPIPHDAAQEWEHYLGAVAEGADGDGIRPLGREGRRIIGHGYAAVIRKEPTGSGTVLAELVPRTDLDVENRIDAGVPDLAIETVNAVPRPLVLVKAVRDSDRHIKGFECVVANPAARDLLGISDIPCSRLESSAVFGYGESRQNLEEKAIEVTETGASFRFEIRFQRDRHSTETRLLSFWMGKVGDGAALLFHDVTAKREEERQLKQYRHMFSHMQEAIIVTDLDGRIIEWNPSAEHMFGYSRSEILGQSAWMLTKTSRGDQVEQQSREVLKHGDVWRGEYEFVRADGTRGIASSVVALLKDDRGRAYGTVGLCHDLTERKRFEEMLTAKTQELHENNIALSTLLRHAESERNRAYEEIALDLTRRLTEGIQRIRDAKSNPGLVESQAQLLLQVLGGSGGAAPIPDADDPRVLLSEKELEVARLIRLGKTTDEVAFMLGKSSDTIRLQRISIRKKLGLTRSNRNLAAHLKRLDLS